MRAAQAELGTRVDARAAKIAAAASTPSPAPSAAAFAKRLGKDVHLGEQRVIHRRMHKPYKTRIRMPSMLDPHLADIERWLADEPRLTALAILGRLAERCPGEFGPPQHTIVQRLLKALRRQAAARLIADTTTGATQAGTSDAGGGKTAVGLRPPSVLPPPASRDMPHSPSGYQHHSAGNIPP